MIGEAQDLLTAVGRSLARSGPNGWRELELKISAAGRVTSTTVSATNADGSVDLDSELDDDGDDAAAELREAMYQEDKGTWYNARVSLDSSGQLDADFDYDHPPFDGQAAPDLLVEDHRLFPRDQAQLPSWHPSRSG
ncbi:immunity protein YezG family protein [Kribbella sp. NPDC056951]|uniref:immunity protein YezG family protein n=1 Tax=Kribbella sp. NPDC056951 TaxID=3345978 RepID=UPI003630BA82